MTKARDLASATPGSTGIPFRMAAGAASVGLNAPVAVTFPASRFSVAPVVNLTGDGGWAWIGTPSSTGFVAYQTQSWGGSSIAGTMRWTAIQMTSSTAAG